MKMLKLVLAKLPEIRGELEEADVKRQKRRRRLWVLGVELCSHLRLRAEGSTASERPGPLRQMAGADGGTVLHHHQPHVFTGSYGRWS